MSDKGDEYDEYMMALDDSIFRAKVIDRLSSIDAKLHAIEKETAIALQVLQLISSTLTEGGHVDGRFERLYRDIDAMIDHIPRGVEEQDHEPRRYRPPRTRR